MPGCATRQWHTTALCSPTRSCLLTGRNHTRNSMACITEAAIGFPNASGTIPPENGMLSEILGERGWNTYMVGKWHLCPTDEMNLAATRRNWPSGRGFERWYGFLGAETNQWYPDLVYDNHLVDQPPIAGGGLPPDRRHHRQGAGVHRDAKAVGAGEAVLPLLRARRVPRPPPRPEGVDREVQGPLRRWATRPSGSRPWPARRRSGSSRPTPSCRRSTRSAPPRPARARTASPFPSSTTPGHGSRSTTTRSGCSARMAEVYAGFLAHADYHIGRLLDYLEQSERAGQHDDRRGLRQRRQRGGRPERLGQRDEVRQRHPRRPGRRTWPRSTSWAARAPTTTTRPGGRWPSTPRSRCGSATSSTAGPPTRASSPGRPASRPAARSATSTTTPSTSCPTILDVLGVEAPRPSRGTSRPPSTGSACGPASTTRPAASAPQDPVLRHARLALDLARGLEGGHHPPGHRRLGALQRRRVGALPHRRRPDRDPQPRRRAAPTRCASWSTSGSPRPAPTQAFPLDDRSAVEILSTPGPSSPPLATGTSYRPGTAPSPSGRRSTPGPLLRHRRAGRHPRARSPRRAVRPRHPLRRPRPLRQGQPAALRQQLRRHRGTEDRRRPRTSPTGDNLILSASFEKDGHRADHTSGTLSLYHGDTEGRARRRSRPSWAPSRSPGAAVRRPPRRRARHRRLPGRAAVRVHRRHDRPGRRRRQRRALRRPRARGRDDRALAVSDGPLASWRDTPARAAIVDFVERGHDRGGARLSCRPPSAMAVFDNDGTLWCEKPMPIEARLPVPAARARWRRRTVAARPPALESGGREGIRLARRRHHQALPRRRHAT